MLVCVLGGRAAVSSARSPFFSFASVRVVTVTVVRRASLTYMNRHQTILLVVEPLSSSRSEHHPPPREERNC